LQIYRDEIDRVLASLGATALDQLTREHVDFSYLPFAHSREPS